MTKQPTVVDLDELSHDLKALLGREKIQDPAMIDLIMHLKSCGEDAHLAYAAATAYDKKVTFHEQWRLVERYSCPHWVLRKRCGGDFRGIGWGCPEFGDLCIDHAQTWEHRESKKRLLTSQPYHLSAQALVNLSRLESEHGLYVRVTTGSFYYPGQTLMVRIGEKE